MSDEISTYGPGSAMGDTTLLDYLGDGLKVLRLARRDPPGVGLVLALNGTQRFALLTPEVAAMVGNALVEAALETGYDPEKSAN